MLFVVIAFFVFGLPKMRENTDSLSDERTELR
jgi:hypothetical protein